MTLEEMYPEIKRGSRVTGINLSMFVTLAWLNKADDNILNIPDMVSSVYERILRIFINKFKYLNIF
jgi:hypothetical protein